MSKHMSSAITVQNHSIVLIGHLARCSALLQTISSKVSPWATPHFQISHINLRMVCETVRNRIERGITIRTVMIDISLNVGTIASYNYYSNKCYGHDDDDIHSQVKPDYQSADNHHAEVDTE